MYTKNKIPKKYLRDFYNIMFQNEFGISDLHNFYTKNWFSTYLTFINSTSKIKVASGGITPPAP